MKTVWTYYGVTIFRNTGAGYCLPFTAYCGRSLAADTLSGMKALIRRQLGK